MAKIKEIIEMTPDSFKTSLLDVLMALDKSKTKKYVPLMVKVIQNLNNETDSNRVDADYAAELQDYYGIRNLPDCLDPKITFSLMHMVGSDTIKDLMNFMDSYEKGYFKGIDITTISCKKELNKLSSLIALNKIGKELSKQVQKDFEDEEWLVIRPFTHESSTKYGYGTKWCTAMERSAEHFFRYSKNGTLIYSINKKNGEKVATYYEQGDGVSFWNAEDTRIDSMFSNLPSYIMEVIRGIITESQITNRLLNPKVWENSKNLWDKLQHKKMEILEEPTVIRSAVEPDWESAELVEPERDYTDFVMETQP